ncbi:R-spondin-3 isoform X2 [Manacus vitellinus]|uniref:R-spondin-3 isoform X2 n=1 Tax=Manacus vitellinus TaxID=328815 RepID=UPI00115D89CB|nr:R-spondin-3 isoform X2 [Manacus vitellinus]
MLPATGPAWTPAAAARLLSAADCTLRFAQVAGQTAGKCNRKSEGEGEKKKKREEKKKRQKPSSRPSPALDLSAVHPNVSQGCQGGCATCSDYNGCLSCKPRLFFVLERIGMKQIGVCLSSCPSGYYGTRYPDINKCAKCKADCDTCFTRNFCTKCKSGFYLYSGKCLEKCPDGLEANNHTMECTSIVHCEASEWSPWSPCTKKGKTCGFKRGNEVRVREIVQHPSAKGNPCPATSESRKCIVQRKRCQKEGKGKKNREEKRKKSNKDESKETRQESKGRAARRQNREQRENNNKTQSKKRKAPNKEQDLAPVDTAH